MNKYLLNVSNTIVLSHLHKSTRVSEDVKNAIFGQHKKLVVSYLQDICFISVKMRNNSSFSWHHVNWRFDRKNPQLNTFTGCSCPIHSNWKSSYMIDNKFIMMLITKSCFNHSIDSFVVLTRFDREEDLCLVFYVLSKTCILWRHQRM